jgi:hypothetical protein
MSEALIKDAITAAVNAAPTVNTTTRTDLTQSQINDIAAAMPPAKAMESLWPQLLRYALGYAGTALAGYGLVSDGEWQTISGLIIAAAPIVWRVATTLYARYRPAGS